MKLKLPEGFRITLGENTNEFCILTQECVIYCKTLADVLKKINIYHNLVNKIKEIQIPELFDLKANLLYDKIVILHTHTILKYADIENVVEELNKCVRLQLQITALNNGEEIELS